MRWLIVIIGVGFPRLMVMGSLPSTDEGVFAYYAQIIHASLSAGNGLPDTGTLMLYPMLLSWVFELSVNHIIFLRLVDMIVALISGWLLYRVVEHESGSRQAGALISLLFLFTINQPIFIQAGFKNSIFAAYIPLFLALRLAQHATGKDSKVWFIIGILTALAILLRETFMPFIIVGAISIFLSQGWRECLRFSSGVAIGGLTITFVILAARGGVTALLDSYRDAGILYTSIENLRIPLLISNGIMSAKASAAALALGALSIAAVLNASYRNESPDILGRLIFWISVSLVPLLEPISKIGFPYHFAVCLPGIAGLTALAWRGFTIENTSKTRTKLASVVVAISALSLTPTFIALTNLWSSTRVNLASARQNTWPAESISQSNYLLAAEAIRNASPPNGTLSISGFMFALYPLTGLLPASYETSHLSAALIKLDLDADRFKNALNSSPPDVLMTTSRTDWPGAEIITRVVEESGLYQPVAEIQASPERSYGNFAGTIYRKTDIGQGDAQPAERLHGENTDSGGNRQYR